MEDFRLEFREETAHRRNRSGEAFKHHPRYKELEELLAEVAKQQEDWQAWLEEQHKQAEAKHQNKLERATRGKQLEKIQAEYSARLEARQKILQEQLTREENARLKEIENKLDQRSRDYSKLRDSSKRKRGAEKSWQLMKLACREKNSARIVNLEVEAGKFAPERTRAEAGGRRDSLASTLSKKRLLALKEAELSSKARAVCQHEKRREQKEPRGIPKDPAAKCNK